MFTKTRRFKFHMRQTKVVETLQIFDLLQLSRREKESRDLCRRALKDLTDWKKMVPDAINMANSPYLRLKEDFLRRHARNSVRLYKMARGERINFFNNYIAALPKTSRLERLAS